MQLNAGRAIVDLGGVAAVSDLEIQVNAGSIGLTLPALSLTGTIQVNAGSVGICVPGRRRAAHRDRQQHVAAYDFDGHGLIHDGSTWTTPGFDTAAVRIDLDDRGQCRLVHARPGGGLPWLNGSIDRATTGCSPAWPAALAEPVRRRPVDRPDRAGSLGSS